MFNWAISFHLIELSEKRGQIETETKWELGAAAIPKKYEKNLDY